MIQGIGCDIVKISRIAEQISEYGDKFLNRIYTANEIANAPEHPKKRVAYFAKRFAGKEAISKALGTGIGKTVAFIDIEILNKSTGAPVATIANHADIMTYISLSDENEFALGYCVITKIG
ncbi:UNVERIFIED_CONTAM: hypothetical protein GTU68_005084 [Idotea baltica]|nr:hypothetical protein [Idotea baltica]